MPTIVLSARGAEATKVAALGAGADDYVTKPLGLDEVLARIRAALRRMDSTGQTTLITTPHFTIDLAAQRVLAPKGEVRLTDHWCRPNEWSPIHIKGRHPIRLAA